MEDTALGEDMPKGRTLLFDIAQHLADMTKAWLANPVIGDRRSKRLETDGHAGQDAKQAWFHDRAPMGDATLNAHPDEGLDEPKAQQRPTAVSRSNRTVALKNILFAAPKMLGNAEARDFGRGMKGQDGRALQGRVIAYALDGEALIDSIVEGQDEPYCAYRRVACAVEQQAMGGMTIEGVLLQPVGMIRLAFKRTLDAINLIANLMRYRDQLAAGGVDRFEMEVEEPQKVSLGGLEQIRGRHRTKIWAFDERVFRQTHPPSAFATLLSKIRANREFA